MTVAGQSSVGTPYDFVGLVQPPLIGSVNPMTGPLAGGTLVTLQGSRFNFNATVLFQELDSTFRATGASAECEWRGRETDGAICTDSDVLCVSPGASGKGRWYQIDVIVDGIPASYGGGYWSYGAPVVMSIAPTVFAPVGDVGTVLISGFNFGEDPGVVSTSSHELVCHSWNESSIECGRPRGVVASSSLTVAAASGLTSSGALAVSFVGPSVAHASTNTSGTRGGDTLTLVGSNFNAVSTPSDGALLLVSVWLCQGAPPSPPWDVQSPSKLRCEVVAPWSSTELSCVIPAGSGVNWKVVVVNHDWDSTAAGATVVSESRWQSSNDTVLLSYVAPSITGLSVVSADWNGSRSDTNSSHSERLPRPAIGGFLVQLTGTNFGPSAGQVTVGGVACGVMQGGWAHEIIVCSAPYRRVDGDSNVVVTQRGQASNAVTLQYDGPVITGAQPSTLIAVDPVSGRSPMTIVGVNFGVVYRSGLVAPHVVVVGGQRCGSVTWQSNIALTCIAVGTYPAGPVNATVALQDYVSPVADNIATALCPVDTYPGLKSQCVPW